MIKNILVIGFDQTSKGGIASVVNTLVEYFENDIEISYSMLKTTHYKDKRGFHQFYILFSSLMKFIFFLNTKRIDIIHIHASYGFSFYRKLLFFFISKLFRKKVIFHIHSSKFYEFYLQRNAFIKYVILKSDLVIVLNQDWLTKLTEKYPNAKIEKIYNPIKLDNQLSFLQKNRGEFLQILFMGFYIKEKGILDLIEVSKSFINKPIKFIFCGKGDLNFEINEAAKSNNNIINMGWVDGSTKVKLFKESDVLILPSYNEGLPISILESMKYSLPVISTNIAGIPEQIKNDVNGYLYTPGDLRHLENIISSFYSFHQTKLNQLRENSFLSVDKFSVERISNKLKIVYKNL